MPLDNANAAVNTAAEPVRFYYGCLFCATGYEAEVVSALRIALDISAIAPVRQHYYRNKGEMVVSETRVFPGYVFFRLETPDYPLSRLRTIANVLRVVHYGQDEWALQGDDEAMAERLFKSGGVIGLSRAKFVDGRLRIIDGFLKPYEKDICKVDKRHRTAMVRAKIDNRTMELWMGYYLDDDGDQQ